jgi:hypothetical protein
MLDFHNFWILSLNFLVVFWSSWAAHIKCLLIIFSVDTSRLLISTCQSLKVTDANIHRCNTKTVVLLFCNVKLADLSSYHWNAVNGTLTAILLHIVLLPLPLQSGRATHSTNTKRKPKRDSVKQILIGQRFSESGKLKLGDDLAILQRKKLFVKFSVGRIRTSKAN